MEWINIKDRLPEDKENGMTFICMTSATGRSKGVIPLRWQVTTIRKKIVRRWLWDDRICPWEVTHWMPLPEPPEN